MTLAELRKEIKMKERRLVELQNYIRQNAEYRYIKDEVPLINKEFNFEQSLKDLERLATDIRVSKCLLHQKNFKVQVGTISMAEALIKLAQLSDMSIYLRSFPDKDISRQSSMGGDCVEYRQTTYKVDDFKKKQQEIEKEISDLQLAIDKANFEQI